MREFEITTPINVEINQQELINAAARSMGVTPKSVGDIKIIRRSLDARGRDILYRYRVEGYLTSEKPVSKYISIDYKNVEKGEPVIVVGAGPAGLFASLKLLERGLKPIILERGKDVHQRKFDLAKLNKEQIVNPDSNYCFGEGGAGTFSDGKLYTRSSKRGDIFEVLSQLVFFGADKDILIDAHPHIGSDRLPGIIEKIRNHIIEHGGEYHFNTRVEDFMLEGDTVKGVRCSGGAEYTAKAVILATGHSARDIYKLFASKGWEIEAKGFAMGVRVEHPQSLINRIQYHGKYQPFMPTAEYSLVSQIEGRGVFSFCMCPGGILVPASTTEGELVLNGMSNSQRNSKWANSGIVVSVEPSDIPDYEKYGVLAQMEFQSAVERAAFEYGGGNLVAPSQRMTDFLKGKISPNLPQSSYVPGTVSAPLDEILPKFITSRMKQAMLVFNKKMQGFITSDAIMLAVESRSSSPVRIPRDSDTNCHVKLKNLYPCGEGAGYAGGIVSSAMDGINVASSI
ncbi:MAG: FAD-dependent oxidoreductase [Bacteroidales bacterium]|nr:FAD-dependent oxidoreductase [Bacteroidales bacterium]